MHTQQLGNSQGKMTQSATSSSKKAPELKVPWNGRGMIYDDQDVQVVIESMNNPDTLTQGKYQREFEAVFSKRMGGRPSFALSSATAALELSAILSFLKPGDEVILPAHTFAATAIPFARTGAKLIWADIDAKTWVISAKTIEKLITPKTKVIIVVHLYGLMADMDPILDLCKKHEIILVEDAAQALGAKYKGKEAGTMGDFSCFSFHTHKNISTLGEGGMIVLKDQKYQSMIDGLRHNGVHAFDGERPQYWIPAMSNVDFNIEGFWPYNFCIGEVQCALGTRLMTKLDAINHNRLKRRERIVGALSDIKELQFQEIVDPEMSAYHLLPAKFTGTASGKTRDHLIERLFHVHGVKTVVQYYPLYRYPMFKKAGFGAANCPETDQFFDNMISFPFGDALTLDQEKIMIDSIRESVKALR